MLAWLSRNKEWVFSGIGVAVLTAFIGWLLAAPDSSDKAAVHQESHGPQSPNTANVGGDVTVTITDQSDPDSKERSQEP